MSRESEPTEDTALKCGNKRKLCFLPNVPYPSGITEPKSKPRVTSNRIFVFSNLSRPEKNFQVTCSDLLKPPRCLIGKWVTHRSTQCGNALPFLAGSNNNKATQ